MGTTGRNSGPDTIAVPGMVYLRRPAGIRDIPEHPPTTPVSGIGPDEATGGGHGTGTAGELLLGATRSAPSRSAVSREIGRLLHWWLEAYDGRRPVAVLRRGPYSPVVLDDLRAQIRASAERRHGIPSRLLTVHLPPSHHRRLSFTASALVDGRVRAMVGHLARYDEKWRVESVSLV